MIAGSTERTGDQSPEEILIALFTVFHQTHANKKPFFVTLKNGQSHAQGLKEEQKNYTQQHNSKMLTIYKDLWLNQEINHTKGNQSLKSI